MTKISFICILIGTVMVSFSYANGFTPSDLMGKWILTETQSPDSPGKTVSPGPNEYMEFNKGGLGRTSWYSGKTKKMQYLLSGDSLYIKVLGYRTPFIILKLNQTHLVLMGIPGKERFIFKKAE